jgi:hypothetical protein
MAQRANGESPTDAKSRHPSINQMLPVFGQSNGQNSFGNLAKYQQVSCTQGKQKWPIEIGLLHAH